MNLHNLLDAIEVKALHGDTNKEITLLTADSRKAGEGAMFVAVRGVTVDGHTFIPTLAGKGSPPWWWNNCPTIPPTSRKPPS